MTVHLLLVDSGTFCNILFKSILDEIGDFADYVDPCEHAVKGFGDFTVKPYHIIHLAVELVSTLDKKVRTANLCDFL